MLSAWLSIGAASRANRERRRDSVVQTRIDKRTGEIVSFQPDYLHLEGVDTPPSPVPTKAGGGNGAQSALPARIEGALPGARTLVLNLLQYESGVQGRGQIVP